MSDTCKQHPDHYHRGCAECEADADGPSSELAPARGYAHPATIHDFESVYRKEYNQELESCDGWIKWCERRNDTHGMNFHQGMRSAHVFNNIKMEQLLRVLKQEAPNAASGHNAEVSGVAAADEAARKEIK